MWGAATPAPVRCRRERPWLRGSHMATGQRAPARCPRCHVCSHPIRCYRCGECSPSARSASALARSLSRWTKARAARVTASTSDRVASRVASVRRGGGRLRAERSPPISGAEHRAPTAHARSPKDGKAGVACSRLLLPLRQVTTTCLPGLRVCPTQQTFYGEREVSRLWGQESTPPGCCRR